MTPLSRRQFTASVGAAMAASLAAARTQARQTAAAQTGLKEVFKDDFLMGTAVGGNLFAETAQPLRDLTVREYNAITPTNAMKWGPIEPREGTWQWTLPDRIVEFGATHGLTVVGHTLVWHSQTPGWLFKDAQGGAIAKDALLQRIESHIHTLVGRYKGRIGIWDVVNEAIDEDEKGWRRSPFLTIAGPEFMERAFRWAHEADPKAF